MIFIVQQFFVVKGESDFSSICLVTINLSINIFDEMKKWSSDQSAQNVPFMKQKCAIYEASNKNVSF